MSAFTTATFAELAPLLTDYGYSCVPIAPGKKGPIDEDWQTPRPPEHYLPRRAAWGVGILTATCSAVDLDIRDKEIVRVLIDIAGEMLGPSPFRIGQPPKALLPFSTTEPFDKITSRLWALPGEDWRAAGYSPHRIEVLASGQQFCAYHRHPRGSWYRWRRGEPMDTLAIDLPQIDQAGAEAFVAVAETVLIEAGAVPLRRQNKILYPDLARPEPPRRERAAAVQAAFDWQLLDPEDLAKRLDYEHAKRTRTGWICSCPAHVSDGHRSLSITPRQGGGSIVHCFADCEFVEISREISALVGRA